MNHTPKPVTALVFLLAAFFLCFATSCASAPVAMAAADANEDFINEYVKARDDGKVTQAEAAQLDQKAAAAAGANQELRAAVARSYKPFEDPTNPINWTLLAGEVVAGLGLAGETYRRAKRAAKAEVHAERDAQRDALGEDVLGDMDKKLAVQESRRRPKPRIAKPIGPVTTGPHTGA